MIGVRDRIPRSLLGWRRLDLATQYLIAGSVSIILIMLTAGAVLNAFLAQNEIRERGFQTALFLEGVFSPLLQDVSPDQPLTPAEIAKIGALMDNPAFVQRFPYLEIWRRSGEVLYSNSSDLIGHHFELPQMAHEAFDGTVSTTFADLGAEEHTIRSLTLPYLEIYAPVHSLKTGEIFAVVEIHETTEALEHSLRQAAMATWGGVGATAVLAFASLFGIVLSGSRTIALQRHALAERLKSSLQLLAQFRQVQEDARKATSTATEYADQRLRLASADLHDGPSQLIGFAALKVGDVRRAGTKADRDKALRSIEASLMGALSEIRSISKGLALPDIEGLTLEQIAQMAVDAHSDRTGTNVVRQGHLGAVRARTETSICVFRVIQEGLNNALRHGAGGQVLVVTELVDERLDIEIVNDVPESAEADTLFGMGLEGLKLRVQLLGGSFSASRRQDGFCLKVSLDLGDE